MCVYKDNRPPTLLLTTDLPCGTPRSSPAPAPPSRSTGPPRAPARPGRGCAGCPPGFDVVVWDLWGLLSVCVCACGAQNRPVRFACVCKTDTGIELSSSGRISGCTHQVEVPIWPAGAARDAHGPAVCLFISVWDGTEGR